MNKPWQVVLILIGIFAAGGVAGGFVTLRVWKDRVTNRPVPEEWAPRHMKRLNDRLELTAEQQEQLRPIVRRNMELLNKIRNASMAETRTVVEDMQREISAKLSPEQKVKFDQMNQEARDREARDKADRAERAKRANGDKPPGDRPPPPRGEKAPEKAPAKPPGT